MNNFAMFALAAAIALPMVSVDAIAEESATVDAKAAKRGKKVAGKTCFACHDMTEAAQNRVGPPLWGIVGKPAGTVEGYEYSQAHLDKVKADSIIWDEATLDAYLKNPAAMIPGNKMVFPGVPKDKNRKNLIEYMKTLK